MSERDNSRQLPVGAGAPADPDSAAAEAPAASIDGGPDLAADPDGGPGRGSQQSSPGDVVQAVAEFVEDLVEDVSAGDGDSR
jgi:hypothetical protein